MKRFSWPNVGVKMLTVLMFNVICSVPGSILDTLCTLLARHPRFRAVTVGVSCSISKEKNEIRNNNERMF